MRELTSQRRSGVANQVGRDVGHYEDKHIHHGRELTSQTDEPVRKITNPRVGHYAVRIVDQNPRDRFGIGMAVPVAVGGKGEARAVDQLQQFL
jgi:hypothetical protein